MKDLDSAFQGAGQKAGLETWRIENFRPVLVPKSSHGKFFTGDSYVILKYSYPGEDKEEYLVGTWFGKKSVEEERASATTLARKMIESLKFLPAQARIYEGSEPIQLFSIFQCFIVFKGGLSSGYKKYVEENGLQDDTYKEDDVALFRIQGTGPDNMQAIQVEAVASSLNSSYCYILHNDSTVFTWSGNLTNTEDQELVERQLDMIKPNAQSKLQKEGSESEQFWDLLGGKSEYPSQKIARDAESDPHLFSCTYSKGNLEVNEIYNFTQDDLMTEDIFILDCHSEIYVWVGQQVDSKTKMHALTIGEKFLEHDFLLEKLSHETPVYIVMEGSEPPFFTRFFAWDSSKSIMHGNSFQRKLTIVKNGGTPILDKPKRRTPVLHGGRSSSAPEKSQRSRSMSFSPERVRVRGRSPAFNALPATFENANARNLSTPPPVIRKLYPKSASPDSVKVASKATAVAAITASFEQPPPARQFIKPRSEVCDFTNLELKPDHANRPLWACGNGRIFLESFSPWYKHAYDFLIDIAEPVCRLETMHEYNLSSFSLYAAVSVGFDTDKIVTVLNMLSKNKLPKELVDFISASTANHGKVKLVFKKNKYFMESPFPEVLKTLLKDEVIAKARTNVILAAANEDKETHSFEIDPSQVENVKQRCMPDALNYPMLEEYDFRKDTVNPDLNMELKPHARPRPYQEKSLSKMFRNGKARSGIIVLPHGAGKSLVGVSAACRIKKSCLCLATSVASADQWVFQFKLWSTIPEEQIVCFTSDNKEMFQGNAGVVVTTYSMLALRGKRSEESKKIIEEIRNREWGLLLMDEVHVVPALKFRGVINITKSHCKLGLTATLLREDKRIADLNFLIGPKLYEADWLDLVKGGFIANVLCAEVWCPMTKEFFAEYLKKENSKKKQALYVMNPNKFRACEFLIKFHEEQRGDKIIVFSDNLFALYEYATRLKKPMINGGTSDPERMYVLDKFKTSPNVNTIFLSKVGDSIDIPEANVIIEISSHAGSRRQEAERLGRILRAKGTHQDRMAGGKEEYNAFFYSLVSTDTLDICYSKKRQQFLIDQGYSFKVITSLPPPDSGADLSFHRLDDQLELLEKVMSDRC